MSATVGNNFQDECKHITQPLSSDNFTEFELWRAQFQDTWGFC